MQFPAVPLFRKMVRIIFPAVRTAIRTPAWKYMCGNNHCLSFHSW